MFSSKLIFVYSLLFSVKIISCQNSNNNIKNCVSNSNKKFMNCKGTTISTANITLEPTYTKYVIRDANMVTLPQINGQKLLMLGVFRCNTSNFVENCFQNLSSLRKLNLSENEFNKMPATVFSPLKNLSALILRKNKIQYLERNQFENLRKLVELDLSLNSLTDVDIELFSHLSALKKLYLNGNLLTSLDMNKLISFSRNLTSIDISGNCFTCQDYNKYKDILEKKNVKLRAENLEKCINPENSTSTKYFSVKGCRISNAKTSTKYTSSSTHSMGNLVLIIVSFLLAGIKSF